MDPTNGLLIFCFIYLFILASYLSVFGGNIYFLCLVTQISCILETSLRFSIALFISIHKLSHTTPNSSNLLIKRKRLVEDHEKA